MTRVVLAAGWSVHHGGRLVAGGDALDVAEALAAHLVVRGWVVCPLRGSGLIAVSGRTSASS